MALSVRLSDLERVVLYIITVPHRAFDQTSPYLSCLTDNDREPPHPREEVLFQYIGSDLSIRRITGWIAEDWRKVTCRSGQNGWRIEIDQIGTFDVALDGSAITYQGGTDDVSLVEQALLGPALALAFAARGIYMLHASALLVNDRAILFMGESGAGKSTLARWLDEHRTEATRIGDDVLPVTLGARGALLALPHFPQLKLPVEQQPGWAAPEQVPVVAAYAVERVDDGDVHVKALSGSAATAALIGGTVAGSLFDDRLRGPHLDFCTQAAARAKVQQLVYPHRAGSLEAVAKTVLNE